MKPNQTKYKRKITFFEETKIAESYSKVNNFTTGTSRMNPRNNKNQSDNSRAPDENLIPLEPND